MARYDAGETLASIARTYDCSPPAISYVVSRTRAQHPEPAPAAKPAPPPEPQLVKAMPGEAPHGGNGVLHDAVADTGGERYGHREPGPVAPTVPPPNGVAPANGDHRRTLHLSLGAPPPFNGGPRAGGSPPPERAAPGQGTPPPVAVAPPLAGSGAAGGDDGRHNPPQRNGDNAPRDDIPFIDHELRARVAADIEAFLAAFDAALGGDTLEGRSALREATDRLLRAGARTRIELERLEARLPLAPRDGTPRQPTWRGR